MRRLSLFAKHWTPGRVKTRLAATLGKDQAAETYREFIVALVGRLAAIGDERTLWFTPKDQRDAFVHLVSGAWRLELQSEGGLGGRMQQFFSSELSHPDARCVLLGTDSPNVPIEFIEQAFDALNTARLVLGPTEDGGYYLIGARGEPPPVLANMPFSTPRLWQVTLDRLAQLGWREGADYAVLPPWYDVDAAEDLERLRRDLPLSAALDPHLQTLAMRIAPL